MFDSVYKNKKVLVTGHTGFKGSWLTAWLLDLGADVAGLSLDVPTEPSNFKALGLEDRITHFTGDIRDFSAMETIFNEFQPDIVFHLAAQALVRRSYADPMDTLSTNIMGTMHVMENIRRSESVQAGVIITSDKCYKNVEWVWGYRETDALGGHDPYSASKGCAEIVAASWMHSYLEEGGPRTATTRAGNVIGGGDWAEDRIVPDCARAWSSGEAVHIRSPHATRPWQLVLEPLSGYLHLGAGLFQNKPGLDKEAFNFGPAADVNNTVGEVVEELALHWPDFKRKLDQNGCGGQKECNLLKLCCDKSLAALNWKAVLDFPTTIRMTAEWYRAFYSGDADMYALTMGQIGEYVAAAEERGLEWTK